MTFECWHQNLPPHVRKRYDESFKENDMTEQKKPTTGKCGKCKQDVKLTKGGRLSRHTRLAISLETFSMIKTRCVGSGHVPKEKA